VARPLTVSIALLLNAGCGAMLALWGVATLLRQRSFTRALMAVFGVNPNADTTVGWLSFLFFAGAAASLGLACALLFLGYHMSHAANWARILSWPLSAACLPFAWVTYVGNGEPYIDARGTGPGDSEALDGMRQVGELTPWRFSGWYHAITIGFGVALILCLVAAAVLLAAPASDSYFR
jgi:hypothetical protein